MNILFPQLARFDIQPIIDTCEDTWFNQSICQINGSVLRLGIMEGNYHWHQHENEDELFFVIEGELKIEIEGKDLIKLKPNQGMVVSKGVMHRTSADRKTVVLMLENIGIDPLGDK